MTTPNYDEIDVRAARQRALEARSEAEEAAADYRRTVAVAVENWRKQGLSIRKCADKIGITEGALRDLLRPAGSSRRRSTRKRTQ